MHLLKDVQTGLQVVRYLNDKTCRCNGYHVKVGHDKLKLDDVPCVTIKHTRGVK